MVKTAFTLCLFGLFIFTQTANAEYSVGMPGAEGTAGYEGEATNPTLQGRIAPGSVGGNSGGNYFATDDDKELKEKLEKLDKVVDENYNALNDGRQEEYTAEVTQMLRAMQSDINAGGDGHLFGEAEKFQEAVMKRLEDE